MFINTMSSIREGRMVLHYMDPDGLCTVIRADYKKRTVEIENKTDLLIHRAFGVKENPTWEDYEEFLKDRCFPETRDKMKIILKQLGLDFYEPLEIIRKTKGRMAEDKQWIEIVEE